MPAATDPPPASPPSPPPTESTESSGPEAAQPSSPPPPPRPASPPPEPAPAPQALSDDSLPSPSPPSPPPPLPPADLEIPDSWLAFADGPNKPNAAPSVKALSTPFDISEFDPLETKPPPPSPASAPPAAAAAPSPLLSRASSSASMTATRRRDTSSSPAPAATSGLVGAIAATFRRKPWSSAGPAGGGGGGTVSSSGRPSSEMDRREQQDGESMDGKTTSMGASTSSTPAPALAFDFPKFLEQLKSKPAEPVAKYLKSFLTNFAKKSFTMNEMIKLVHDFLSFITARMSEVEPWKSMSEPEFENAMDCMEKLVMNRLYPFTFTPTIDRSRHHITTDDLEKDAILRQRIRLFSWVEAKHLDVLSPPQDVSASSTPTTEEGTGASASETFQGYLDFAASELLKINHYKAPRDKLICILNCCKVIFGLIRWISDGKPQHGGADAFVPILIYVVLKANPEHLISNVEYINRFRSASRLQSEAGYYLSSLMGSISFIEAMDYTSLTHITKAEFEANVEYAVSTLPPQTPPSPHPHPNAQHQTLSSSSITHASAPFTTTADGEEPASALPSSSLTFTSVSAAVAQTTETLDAAGRRFFERTNDAVSALGKIFSEAVEDISGGGPPLGLQGGQQQQAVGDNRPPYQARVRSPRPRSFVGGGVGGPQQQLQQQQQTYYQQQHLLPSSHHNNSPSHLQQQQQQQQPSPYPSTGAPPPLPAIANTVSFGDEFLLSEDDDQIDYEQLQRQLDARDREARTASLSTLSQMFPDLDAELAALVLDEKGGDLDSSVDALIEMAGGA